MSVAGRGTPDGSGTPQLVEDLRDLDGDKASRGIPSPRNSRDFFQGLADKEDHCVT